MNQQPYQRDPITKEFDNRLIVQFTQNYRSHSAILQPSNKLFYENTLKAMASPGHYLN